MILAPSTSMVLKVVSICSPVECGRDNLSKSARALDGETITG